MKTPQLIAACLATSALTAFGVSSFSGSSASAQAPTEAASAAPDQGLSSLTAALERLEARLDRLELEPARNATRSSSSSSNLAEVEDLVEAALASRLGSPEAAGEAAPYADLLANPIEAVDAILRAGHGSEEAAALWEAAREAGKTEELLDVLRKATELDPNSAEAHYDLARGALAVAQADPNHPNGTYWSESDNAYGDVLDIAPDRTDARFEKAVNLCFWPDVLGRKPEALSHFETLVDQGSIMDPSEHLQSHVWLGNLYLELGRYEDAKGIWNSGLAQYPGDETLLAKLGDLSSYQ